MSAKDQIRQKLDELMGTGWDGVKNPLHYSDPKVCRCFLLGLCPHDALAGTKMSMGACSKIHNYALKADYESSSKTCRSNQHRFYELTVLTYLQKVIRSCEIMDRAKKGRLTRCQSNSRNGRISDKEAELKAYGELVDKKLVEAEELGSKGKVQEALAVIRDVERLKRRRTRIEMYLDRRPNEPVKEQKQNICEECQLCIGLDDNEQRIANHSSGRLHNALLDMRRKISELANNLEKAQVPGDWARFEVSQQQQQPLPMRLSSRLDLASTRAHSYSPRSSSSRERRGRSRSRSRSRRRSYSSDSYSSYCSSRSRSGSRYRSRSRSRRYSDSRSRSRSRSRGKSRSRSSCRSCSRSTSSRHGHRHSRSRSYSRSYTRSRSNSSGRSHCSGSHCRSRSRSRSGRRASRSRSRSHLSVYRDRRHHRGDQSHLSRSPGRSVSSKQDKEERKVADGSHGPKSDTKELNVKDDSKLSSASKDGGQEVAVVKGYSGPSGPSAKDSAENAVARNDNTVGSGQQTLATCYPNIRGHRLTSVKSNTTLEDTARTKAAETPANLGAVGETKSVEVTRAPVEQLKTEKSKAPPTPEGSKASSSTKAKPRTSGENKMAAKRKNPCSKTKVLCVRENHRLSAIKKHVINFATLKLFCASQGLRKQMKKEQSGEQNLTTDETVTELPTSVQPPNDRATSQAHSEAVQPAETETTQSLVCSDREGTRTTGQEGRKSRKQISKQDTSTASISSGKYQASAESLAEATPKVAKKKKRKQPPPTKPTPRNYRGSECSETSSSSVETSKPKKKPTKKPKQSVPKSTKADASKTTRKPPRRLLNSPSADESECSSSSCQSPPPKRAKAKGGKRSRRSPVTPTGSSKRRGDASTKASKKKKANAKKRHKSSPVKKASAKTSSRRQASSSDTSSESDSEDRKTRRRVKLVKKVKKVKRKKCK
ncbi:uncharacterized protein LOC144108880 [Amblyomma americanum]